MHPRLPRTRAWNASAATVRARQHHRRGNTVLVQNLSVAALGLNDRLARRPPKPRPAESPMRSRSTQVPMRQGSHGTSNAFVDAVPVRREEVPAAFERIRGAQQRTVVRPAAKSSGTPGRCWHGGYATEAQAEASLGIAPGDIVGTSACRSIRPRAARQHRQQGLLTDRSSPVGQTTPKHRHWSRTSPTRPAGAWRPPLDDDIQTAAEELLEDTTVPASVVVLHKDTGAILAAADSPLARRGNDAIEARFPPGLAAGPVAALALMRSGVKLSERVACEPEVVIDGRRFDNGANYTGNRQMMTIAEAIAGNCVTAVARAATRVDPEKVTRRRPHWDSPPTTTSASCSTSASIRLLRMPWRRRRP